MALILKNLLNEELNENIRAEEASTFNSFKSNLEKLCSIFDPKEREKLKLTEEPLKSKYINPLLETFGYETNLNYMKTDLLVKYGDKHVLVETKNINNSDILTLRNGSLNCRAFYQTVKYYLDLFKEFKEQETNIRRIIITNGKYWFFFGTLDYKISFLSKEFMKFIGVDTLFGPPDKAEDFYKAIETYLTNYPITITAYLLEIDEKKLKDESYLKKLYNIFKPEFLFDIKKESKHELNKNFYNELLYILGLKETDDHKIIKADIPGSLYNLIENQLEFKKKSFSNAEEKNEVIMELIVLWLNRILFLKLFENILYESNGNNEEYKFLTVDKVKRFSDLNELFFEVLAKHPEDRLKGVKEKYEYIPYLNSSLFEIHNIELNYLFISDLPSSGSIEVYSKSILKDKQKQEMCFIEYLLKFLDSYEFSDRTSKKKEIISPAVLGLVFEKINGYKEGSFYTPTDITGKMVYESINNYLLNEVNKKLGVNYQTITFLKSQISKDENIANQVKEILDNITICDPAVGSGHFLVSALDYLLYLNYDLFAPDNIDFKKYKVMYNNYEVEIFETDSNGNLVPFVYRKTNTEDENYKFQKYLFETKKKIIENQLFGVDINPKSVEIARLRLWIELLKNAFYAKESNFKEMQVLPNIDINIVCGDSLTDEKLIKETKLKISFEQLSLLDDKDKKDTKEVLMNYKKLHNQYINSTGKEKSKIKDDFLKIKKQIYNLYGFKEIPKNFISWMAEFPTATLNDDGSFKGFSVVIANPPYIRQEEIKPPDYKNSLVNLYKDVTTTGKSQTKRCDLYVYFINLAYKLLQPEGVCYIITSNKWMRAKYGMALRKFLKENTLLIEIIDYGSKKVFDIPTVDVCIIGFQKTKPEKDHVLNFVNVKSDVDNVKNYIQNNKQSILQQKLSDNVWTLAEDKVLALKEKIEKIGKPLKDWDVKIYYGIKTGFNEAFIIDTETKDKILENCKNEEERKRTEKIIKPVLRGRDIERWRYKWAELWLIGTFPALNLNIDNYPTLKEYLKSFGDRLNQDGKPGHRKKTNNKWFETQDNIAYYPEFEKEKIVWNRITEEIVFSYVEANILCYTNSTLYIAYR